MSLKFFAHLRNTFWRITPRMAVLVAWEVREKLRQKSEKCSLLDSEEVKLFKSTSERYAFDMKASVIMPPMPVVYTSPKKLFQVLPNNLQRGAEDWYSDINDGSRAPLPFPNPENEPNIGDNIEQEQPPNASETMEVEDLQEAIAALAALQSQLFQIQEQFTQTENTEVGTNTEEPETNHNPENVAGVHFAAKMPKLHLNYFHSTVKSPLLMSWKSDFQGEAQRIVNVSSEFIRDCGRKTAAMGREFLDATTDEKIAAAIIKAVQDLAALMKRMAVALMEMVNKILEALGIKKETIQATALSVAQVVSQVAKRGAEKCTAEAKNCQLIAKNIVNDAKGEGKKEIGNIVKSLNNFGTTVGNFSNKLEKEAQLALLFTKELLKK